MTTPTLALSDADVTSATVDAVVVGTVEGTDGPELAPGAEAVDAAFDGELLATLSLLGATGKADDVVKLPTGGKLAAPLLVAVGLGRRATGRTAGAGGVTVGGVTAEQARRA
ncbi:MAG TPA: M17 family peptidase N-terminal domain-containing protein, partial [Pseudonocardiaceae bacterium]